MTTGERQQLIAEHLLFKDGDLNFEASGLSTDWPSNRGIFHNHAKDFAAWVNEEDHLTLIAMQPGNSIAEVFERLLTVLKEMDQHLEFQYDDHLGYITSCPTNLGTGMRASYLVHLPGLA